MKKNRRVLSFALAFVMLVSLLPLSAVFSALAVGEDTPDISVVMTADKEICNLNDEPKVQIEAKINNTKEIASATVKIHFGVEEVAAIQAAGTQPDWKGATYANNTLTIELTQTNPQYTADFQVAAPKGEDGTPQPFTFEVTGDDENPTASYITCEYIKADIPKEENNNTDTSNTEETEEESTEESTTPPSENTTEENSDQTSSANTPSDTPEQTGDESTDVEETPDENESTDEEETPDENEPTNEDAAPQVKGVSYLVNDPDTSEPSKEPFLPKVHLQGVTITFVDQSEEETEKPQELPFLVTKIETDAKDGIAPIDRKLTNFTVEVTTSLEDNVEVPKAGGSYTFYLQITLPEEMNLESVPDGLVSLAGLEASGATLGEVLTFMWEYSKELGYIPSLPFGHIVGLDLDEAGRSSITSDLELKENMTFVLHPTLLTPDIDFSIFWGQSYLVTEHGGEALSAASHELLTIK